MRVAALAACLASVFASREFATDHPSFKTAALGCRAAPQGSCFSNAANKIARVSGVTADPGDCCLECSNHTGCLTYNHGDSGSHGFFCDLFSTVGPVVQKSDGCSAGYHPSSPAPKPRGDLPNIVFLVVESTDGRTWSPGYSNDAIPLPSIRELQQNGVEFRRHYSNAPVCCPSRATFWSGRHASEIRHENTGIVVDGVWNNFEGLPANYSDRIDQVLSSATEYNVKVSGKTDWATGGHSENVYLNAWTMYSEFPYNVNKSGGWYTEVPSGSCASHGSVKPGGGPKNGSAHAGDWSTVDSTTQWMRQVVSTDPGRPFFVFQGMVIVHPPYATNEFWNNKIDRTKVQVPAWQPLMEMHPCDFQSSMLKGCTPSDANAEDFYSQDRRREIRAKYYAMIAEFDAMVGEYMRVVKELGVWNNTVFIVTSDHGDMQMEKQQFYKMVPYDASASVPMVVFDGRHPVNGGRVVTQPTQLIDIFPTIMDLAKVPQSHIPTTLDGHSLLPLLASSVQHSSRPDFVVSQFHGDDIAMSWFLVVQSTNHSTYKLILWGSNQQVPALLFDLVADPSEENNLIGTAAGLQEHQQLVSLLESSLRSVVDYPAVAQDVAQYNLDSLAAWVKRTPDWQNEIHKSSLRWSKPWDQDPDGSLAAVQALLAAPATIKGCRLNLTRS